MGRAVGLAVAVALSAEPATAADLDLATHGSGQVADGFGTASSYTNLPLFRFRLQNTTGSAVTVDEIRFRLQGLHGFAFGDATNLRIHDGTSDVATGGLTQLNSSTNGAFTFLDDWTVPPSSTVDYTLYGDIANLTAYDTVPVALDALDVTTVASVAGAVSPGARHVADGTIGDGMRIIYSDDGLSLGTATPIKESTYSAGWSPTPGVAAITDPTNYGWWKLLRTKPDFSEQVAVVRDSGGGGRPVIRASFWDGTNWDDGAGSPFGDSYDVSFPMAGSNGDNNSSYDAAYESLSGRLLIVSAINTTRDVRYSVWDGAAWTSDFLLEDLGVVNNMFVWVDLIPIPGTNKVAFIGLTATGEGGLAVWNGDTSTWIDKQGIGLSGMNVSGDAAMLDVVRTGVNAGEVLAAYGNSTSIRRRIYLTNAGPAAWSGVSTAFTLAVGKNPMWLRSAANPDGDDIVVGYETADQEIHTVTYDGDTRAWGPDSGNLLGLAAFGNAANHRPFDISWDPISGSANLLLAYSDTAGLKFRTSDDGAVTWNGESTIDATHTYWWVQMAREPNGVVHLAATYTDPNPPNNDILVAWTWSGSSWTFETATPISSDVGVKDGGGNIHSVEPFALSDFPFDVTPATMYRSIGPVGPYSAGTVTMTAGSPIVTATGALWQTFRRGRGDRFHDTTNGRDYVVLSVDAQNQLTLDRNALNTVVAGPYVLDRQFDTLQDWADCVTFVTSPCAYFPVASNDLVADHRREIGIAYDDATPSFTDGVDIPLATTDADHYITLTVDAPNRHDGTAGSGVVVDGQNVGGGAGRLQTESDYTVIEWIEVTGVTGPSQAGIRVREANNVLFQNVLSHHNSYGFTFAGSAASSMTVRNSILYENLNDGIGGGTGGGDTISVESCTLYRNGNMGIDDDSSIISGTVTNTISMHNGWDTPGDDIDDSGCGTQCFVQSYNITSDNSANGTGSKIDLTATNIGSSCSDPGGEGCVTLQNLTVSSEDLHLRASTYTNQAVDAGTDLSLTFHTDIDGDGRPGGAAWDIGADEFGSTTAVELMGLEALPGDGAVDLSWQTGSELDNLGFHAHRSLSEAGPWERVTPSLIPGLGSSPEGASYSWTDTGLTNGTRYFYRLEDVDSASVSTFHGPVSAVPQVVAGGGDDGGGEPGAPGPSPAPPEGTEPPPGETPPVSEASCPEDGPCLYGDPGEPSFRVLSRTAREVTVELATPGFVATPDPEGISVDVAGFASPTHTHAVDLPFKRALLDAVVGRRARLVSIETRDEISFPELRPASLGTPEVDTRPDGTVRPVRRRLPVGPATLSVPRARIAGDAFMGHAKKLALELHPLRWDPAQNRLVLSRTLRVRIAFAGDVPGETGSGSFGRRNPRPRRTTPPVFAHFHTTQKGLHAVAYEDVFPSPRRAAPLSALRLVQDGRVVPFHVEPPGPVFGPGSVLFFHADRTAASTDYTGEVSWALERAAGTQMASASAAPSGAPLASASYTQARFETQKIYQSGLLEAPDIWLWDFVFRGVSKDIPLSLEGVDTTSPLQARVRVYLQGASDSAVTGEHHITASWNGVLLDDISFERKLPYLLEGTVPASALAEGSNTLTLTNVGDTGVYSLVFLDKVEIDYPQAPALRAGRFTGTWTEDGAASVSGTGSLTLDVTDPAAPVWLTGAAPGPGGLTLQAQADRRYAVVSPEGLLTPRVSRVASVARRAELGLRDTRLQADYILVAPEAFMDAAQPLLQRREGQGLTTFAASLEQIASEFGGGSPSGEAIRDFLAFAFHSWKAPAPRYVLLLGDASYDPRNFTGSDPGAPLPALWTKTSYLWTASDPALAAVNGEDLLPDLALGRLPATNLAQAQALVQKVLDWEDAGYDLSGPATLVADDPDRAGNFEADIADISNSFLAPRNPQSLLIRVLGASTKPAILASLDSGLSLLSYVGHGAPASWASENVLNSLDPPALRAQSRQPLMLTLNCLNGYFVSPVIDSLAEAFLKVEGRGTIAAFSPTGLSLDGPAHVFHRAVLNEVVNGNHQRLGDAVFAAQTVYAASGQMPELLAVYHLFGDPAMKIAPETTKRLK